jgi:hypothetical protein
MEAEAGTLGGNASTADDAAASGGKAVQFKAGSNTGGGGASTYNAAVLADNPVAFWNVGGNDKTETDLTGGGLAGAYHGTVVATKMPNGDSAAVFPGTAGNYVQVPDSPKLSVVNQEGRKYLTWEAWMRPDAVAGFPSLQNGEYTHWLGKCEEGNSSGRCEWLARLYPTDTNPDRCNRISAYIYNPSNTALGSGMFWQAGNSGKCTAVQVGKWLHVVGQYQVADQQGCGGPEVGTIEIWVNGAKRPRNGTTGCMSEYHVNPLDTTSSFFIGRSQPDSSLKGAIGKVAIYNHPLTEAQIKAHYKAMTGHDPTTTCGDRCNLAY